MEWFLVALIAPFLWSLLNHLDKFILAKYFHDGGSGGLMVFVGVVAVPFAILIALFNPQVLSLGATDAVLLIVSGICYNLGAYLCVLALEKDEASYVIPFWQLVPVFAYVFGVFFLAEYLEPVKLIGGAIVLGGALILSLDFVKGKGHGRFKVRTALIMALSSAILAFGYVIFKDADGATTGFWMSMFWNQVGMVLFGLVFFLIPHFRREFFGVIRQNSREVLSLNIGEQVIEVGGVVANNFAILLAPAAIVILVEYTAQPLFVFLFGILFTLLLPHLVKEDLSKRALAQKLIAMLVMGAGLFLVI